MAALVEYVEHHEARAGGDELNRSVVYLMTGKAHVPYLLVCLHTLRQHYDGQVVIYCTEDDTAKLCYKLGERFGAEVRRTEAMKLPKNVQFTTKVRLFAEAIELPEGVACYLDADLIIRSSIDILFEAAAIHGFCATQFCEWTTQGGIIARRIERFREFKVDQSLVDEALNKPYPSPNGGVFAAVPGMPCCKEWLAWTVEGNPSFIADETALNILLPKWMQSMEAGVIAGGAFNCSPKHKPESLAWDEVVILHGHGDSFARPEKKGVEHWLPLFRECWQNNLGGCRDWKEWHCGNKHLRKLGMEVVA